MALQTITVHAPRKKALDPDNPGNRVVLFERDKRHPSGEVFIAEGDTVEAYPTKEIKVRLGSSLVEVRDGVVPSRDEIDPESLGSLGLSGSVTRALGAANIDSVTDLLDAWTDGRVTNIKGIAEHSLEAIKTALAKRDLIDA